MKTNLLSFLFLALWGFSACQHTELPEAPNLAESQKDRLVSAEKLTTLSAVLLQQLALSSGQKELANVVKYDVDVYRLVYLTTYNKQEVQASGLMVIPLNMQAPAPILSAHHGTTFDQKYAPSNFQLTSLTGFESFGAAGYLTLVPDYLGYGVSQHITHPYYDVQHSGTVVVDMIKAGKSFFLKNNIKYSDQLFLAGYSECGYVTLAAQKEIAENAAYGLKVTASGAGAGGYDLEHMLARIISGDGYDHPANLAFILQAYNRTYHWNRPLTDFFQEPYATRIQELIDGTRTSSSINSALSSNPAELFNPVFLASLRADGEVVLKQALKKNSLRNYVPASPTRLYHGSADTMVPFENSEITFKAMLAAGAANNVRLISIPGGTHQSSLEPMIQDLIPWMEGIVKTK